MKTSKSTTLLATLLTLLFDGCADTSITPAQFTAAEQAATPIINALAAKYPSDTAAIDAGWGILEAITAGAPATTATSPVLAALPAGTSSGTAQAALTTAIAILGTPGAPAAARTGHLRQFCRTHQIEPLKPRIQGNPPRRIATWDMPLEGEDGIIHYPVGK